MYKACFKNKNENYTHKLGCPVFWKAGSLNRALGKLYVIDPRGTPGAILC